MRTPTRWMTSAVVGLAVAAGSVGCLAGPDPRQTAAIDRLSREVATMAEERRRDQGVLEQYQRQEFVREKEMARLLALTRDLDQTLTKVVAASAEDRKKYEAFLVDMKAKESSRAGRKTGGAPAAGRAHGVSAPMALPAVVEPVPATGGVRPMPTGDRLSRRKGRSPIVLTSK